MRKNELVIRGRMPSPTILERFRHRLRSHAACVVPVMGLDAVDDVVQETFHRAIISWRTRDPKSPLDFWLLRIQKCVISDFLRKQARQCPAEEMRHMLMSGILRNSEVLDVENKVLVLRLLSELAVDEASILILRDYRGLKWDDIAQITGKTVGQLRLTHVRARKNARKLLAA